MNPTLLLLIATTGVAAPQARPAPEPIAAAPSDAPPPEVTPDPNVETTAEDGTQPDPAAECPEPPKCDCDGEAGAAKADTDGGAAAADVGDEANLDATEFSIGAGFTLNTGNTNNYAGNTVAKFRVRRGIHQSTTSFLANVGSASADRDEVQAVNVSNQQLRSGYDVLLPKRFSVFVQAQWRRDTFQGLDTRININPGVGYYFLDRERYRLWTQLGYGYQYDVRTKFRTYDADDNGEIFLDDQGQPTVVLDRFVPDHQARIFLASDNQFNDHVGLNASVEYLQSFLRGSDYILNGEFGITAHLLQGLSINLNFILRYENEPLPRVMKLDTNTIFSLVYKFGGTEDG